MMTKIYTLFLLITRTWSTRSLVAAALIGLLATGADSIAAEPVAYGVDYVSSPAWGNAMNDQGVVAGVLATLPPGCTPSTCAPIYQTVVWSSDTVMFLPVLPGFATVTAVSINASGWVGGYAGDPTNTGARAVVWKPTGTSYTAINLGVLPGTTSSWAAGIDDLGRVVGY